MMLVHKNIRRTGISSAKHPKALPAAQPEPAPAPQWCWISPPPRSFRQRAEDKADSTFHFRRRTSEERHCRAGTGPSWRE